MCRAIGLRQPVANVRQSDAGRRACSEFAALTIAVIGDFDPHGLPLALAR